MSIENLVWFCKERSEKRKPNKVLEYQTYTSSKTLTGMKSINDKCFVVLLFIRHVALYNLF